VIGPRVAGTPWATTLQYRLSAIQRLVREQPAAWLPAGDPDWDATLLASWRAALGDIERQLGHDRARWRWGALNRMAIRHPLTRAFSPLGRLLDPPVVDMGGSATTVNVLWITPSGGTEGPSMRFVANLADPDDTRLVNFMGESGHAASEHYRDQFDPWVRVESRRFPFTPEAVSRETTHSLRLLP
jgi:penicillin G amidase